MDSALRPRDIQARIRSGRSVDEVAAAAGMSAAMVERFAAPVLAEREYVAGQAMTAPVRRRGEVSAHRKLRVAVSERLMARRVDIDQVDWDSARMEDGRWAVIASYHLDDARHDAVFHFDVPGRFSVAGNTEARWLLGEDVDAADDEPTVDLGDGAEPATPATQQAATSQAATQAATTVVGPPQVEVAAEAVPQVVEHVEPAPEPVVTLVPPVEDVPPAAAVDHDDTDDSDHTDHPGGLDVLYDILDRSGTEYTEDSVEIIADAGARHGDPASDAAAVPDTASTAYVRGAAADDYPVEPSLFDEEPEFAAPAKPRRRPRASVPEVDLTPAPEVGPVAEPVAGAEPVAADEPTAEAEPSEPAPPAKKPRSKRASVPSWDEIMFGSPRSKG